MTTYQREAHVDVDIEINDPNVIDRVVNNEAAQNGRGEWIKWRDMFYDLRTEEDVLNHLTFNAVRNGVEDVSVLDGWADLPRGAATMFVVDVDPEW